MKHKRKVRKTYLRKTKKIHGGEGEELFIDKARGEMLSLMDDPLSDLKLSETNWKSWLSKTFMDANNSINNYFNALGERDKKDLCIKILTLKKYLQQVINNNESYSPKAKEVLFEIFYLPLSLIEIDYNTLKQQSSYWFNSLNVKIDENKIKEQGVDKKVDAWIDYKKNKLLNDFMFLLKMKDICDKQKNYTLWTEVSGFYRTRNFFKHRFFREPFKWFRDKINNFNDQSNISMDENGKKYFTVDARAIFTDSSVKAIIDDIEKDVLFTETGFHNTSGGKKNKTRKNKRKAKK